ncbi:MAG: AI-2E family transporter [Pirellulaceae bacterium]|nr:AI-2E family transporter [Pirellulaceae bacterium]
MAKTRTTNWQRTWPTLVKFILVVLVIGCLYVASAVLIPVTLAVLVTFLLTPPVSALQRRGFPRTPSVLLVLGAAGLLAVFFGTMLAAQFIQFSAELPTYEQNVIQRIDELQKSSKDSPLARIQEFVEQISKKAADDPESGIVDSDEESAVAVKVVDREGVPTATIFGGLQTLIEPLASFGLAAVLAIYLLIYREDARSRMLCVVGKGHLTLTTKALDEAGRRISRFLLAQFIVNLGFGVVVAGGLWLLGIPYALLLGFCAGLLRYIPYIGPWIAAILPIGLSLLASEGWIAPLGVAALFIVCELLTNLVIEPYVFGQSIGVSQSALIVAIAFWTWLWGPMGLLLAAPLTVCLVVLGKYVPSLRFFDVLLGDEPVLSDEVAFYQRLLARDQDEAADIIRRAAADRSAIALADGIATPALVLARQDWDAGLITDDEFEQVVRDVEQIMSEHEFVEFAGSSGADTDKEEGPRPERELVAVLAIPGQDLADTIALSLFERFADLRGYQLETTGTDHLVGELLDRVEREQPAVVLIAAVPPGGLTHTRYLCKRLRNRFPQIRIVVGRWGATDLETQRQSLNAAGADYLGTTFEKSAAQLAEIAQFARPAQAAPPPIPVSVDNLQIA